MTPDSSKPKKEIRVRFAPSPTGYFHIGSARTVLFNWLFVRHNKGKFILRVEDTDTKRSKPEYEKDILDGIKWLGLEWDEGPDIGGPFGPYRQSERLNIYEIYLKKLLDEEKAYYCFCSKEQLEEDRQGMMAQGLAPKYTGRCRHINREDAEKRIKNGESSVIRFKTPEVEVEFNDLIRGKIKFDASLIGDIIIAKSVKEPLYNFAVVIDDALMKITHIIRGEDHVSNTPKQMLLAAAMGFETPIFAHLPLILSTDRRKMSKRFDDVALDEYKVKGYSPEAVLNFIAFLGWHPVEEKDVMSREELIKEFKEPIDEKNLKVMILDWLAPDKEKMLEYIKDVVKNG